MLGVIRKLPISRCIQCFERTFSSVFDISRDPTHWPKPLKSCPCNSFTSSDIRRTVTVAGWVDSIRIMKDSVFIILRDGSGMVQTLFPYDKDGEGRSSV